MTQKLITMTPRTTEHPETERPNELNWNAILLGIAMVMMLVVAGTLSLFYR